VRGYANSVFEPFTERAREVVGEYRVLETSETETMTHAVLDDRGAEA
jgi:hypothetical protein